MRVENRSASAAVIALALVRTRFATLTLADKCDFCAESRLAKGFPPICVSACPEHALIFGREDSPEIQAWLQDNKYYQYQLPGAGKPHLYRRFGQHLIKKENV